MIQYYYGDVKYDPQQLRTQKGIKTFDYFCPFFKDKVNEEGYCVCKQKRVDGLCQIMKPWAEQDDQKSEVIKYLLADKEQNQGQDKTKGEKGDNWFTGVKNCNDLNCDEYAKILVNGISNYIARKNGLDKSEEKEVIKKGEEDQKKPEN